MQRHMLFAVSACFGVAALVVALLLHAPLAYSIGANAFFAAYVILCRQPDADISPANI